MERAEVLKRVIGILTEAQEIRRAAETGEDDDGRDDDRNDGGYGEARAATAVVATTLLNEMLPSISVPADATPQEVASLVAEALGPALHTMVSGFSLAFTSLAIAHDNGRTDISALEVLQELALEIEAGTYDEGA
uniref:TetR family transcriptional regulator n=1 Tax=Streptomyces sp. NBC_00049 TaxID=2903617 RepID=A0AAU2K2F8_9ACTN